MKRKKTKQVRCTVQYLYIFSRIQTNSSIAIMRVISNYPLECGETATSLKVKAKERKKKILNKWDCLLTYIKSYQVRVERSFKRETVSRPSQLVITMQLCICFCRESMFIMVLYNTIEICHIR